MTICLHDGCVTTPLLNRSRCSKHHPQFEKYGFSWDQYPHEKMADWRNAQRETCAVAFCENKQSSKNSPICRVHGQDRARKKLDLDFYVNLMRRDSCEICHDTLRLSVDHTHGHHENDEVMCPTCIRGRICAPCNSMLGFAGDDPARFLALAAYLLKSRGA